jgi:hypothetical protein
MYEDAQLDECWEKLPRWPQILLEVVSLDSWGRWERVPGQDPPRQRVEGYGHAALPLDPGRARVAVPTWRPAGSHPAAEMRRCYFLIWLHFTF